MVKHLKRHIFTNCETKFITETTFTFVLKFRWFNLEHEDKIRFSFVSYKVMIALGGRHIFEVQSILLFTIDLFV